MHLCFFDASPSCMPTSKRFASASTWWWWWLPHPSKDDEACAISGKRTTSNSKLNTSIRCGVRRGADFVFFSAEGDSDYPVVKARNIHGSCTRTSTRTVTRTRTRTTACCWSTVGTRVRYSYELSSCTSTVLVRYQESTVYKQRECPPCSYGTVRYVALRLQALQYESTVRVDSHTMIRVSYEYGTIPVLITLFIYCNPTVRVLYSTPCHVISSPVL